MPSGRPGTVAPHGTRSRFNGTKFEPGCRCAPCRDANNAYMAVYNRTARRKARQAREAVTPQVEPRPAAILSSLLLGDWADNAACAGPAGQGVDFHPSVGTPVARRRIDDDSIARARRKARRALAVCAGCMVTDQCLRAALAMPSVDDFGVWGGTVEAERVRIRRGRVAA